MEELLRHGTAAPAAFNETQDLLSKLELTQLNDAAAASSVDIETPLTFGFEHVTPELRRRADEQFQLTKLNSLVPQPVAPLTPPAHETVAVAAPSPELPDVLLNKRKPEPQQSLESQLVAMVENAIADQPSQPQPELSDEEAPQPELSDEEAPPPPPVVTEKKKKSKKEKHKRKHAEKKKKKKQRDTSPQRVSTKTKQHVAEKSAAAKPEPSPPAKEKRKHTEEKAAPEKKQKLDDPLLDLPPPPRAAATAAALPARESLPRRSRPTKIIDPIYLVSSSDDEAEESNGGGSAKRSRAKAKPPPPPPIESATVSTVAPPLLRLENAIDRSLRDSRGGSVSALMSELAEPRKLHRKLFDEFCQLARSVIGLLTGQLPRLDEQALETRVRAAARKVWPDQAQHWPFIEFGGYSSVQHGADTIKIQLATSSQTASFSFTDLRTTLVMTSLWIAANPRALLIRLLAALETERQRLEDIDQEREFAKAFRVWFNFTVFSRFHHGLLS
jgi:hypothetical protein